MSIVCLLVIAFVAVFTPSALGRSRPKRSVNFTPSWGKRSSGNFEVARGQRAMMNTGPDDKCIDRGLYLEILVDNLKVRQIMLVESLTQTNFKTQKPCIFGFV